MVCFIQWKLETNILRFFPKRGQQGIKNHSLNFALKQAKQLETRRKTFLKPVLVVKEVFQAFGLLVNKAVQFTEAFKYAITSVPLAKV